MGDGTLCAGVAIHPDHPNLEIFHHPLIQRKLTVARDVNTTPADFRRLLNEIAGLMTFQASQHFDVEEIEQVMTQLQQAHRDSKKHWTFVAQQGAVNHLMAMFGHADYRADAITAYRNAVTGREDQKSARPFVIQLNRMGGN